MTRTPSKMPFRLINALTISLLLLGLSACGGGGKSSNTNHSPQSSLASSNQVSSNLSSSLKSSLSSDSVQSSSLTSSSNTSSSSQTSSSTQSSSIESSSSIQSSSSQTSSSTQSSSIESSSSIQSSSSQQSSSSSTINLPPQINFVFPGAVSASTASQLTIRGRSINASGVGALIVRVHSAGTGSVTEYLPETSNGWADWTAEIDLEIGHNVVTLEASNLQSNNIPNDASIRIERINSGASWTNQVGFRNIRDFDVTLDGKIAYAVTYGRPIARVDLDTGAATYIYRPGFPASGEIPNTINAITLDTRRNRLYTAEASGRIFRIDINTGDVGLLGQKVFSEPLGSSLHPSGDSYPEGIMSLKYDDVNDRLLILGNYNGGEIYAINNLDATTTAVTTLVQGVAEDAVGYLGSALSFTFDFASISNSIYVLDPSSPHLGLLIKINTNNQSREQFFSFPINYQANRSLAIDSTKRTLLVLDRSLVMEVNEASNEVDEYFFPRTSSTFFNSIKLRSKLVSRNGQMYASRNSGLTDNRPDEIYRITRITRTADRFVDDSLPYTFYGHELSSENIAKLSRLAEIITPIEITDVHRNASQQLLLRGRFSINNGLETVERSGLVAVDPEHGGLTFVQEGTTCGVNLTCGLPAAADNLGRQLVYDHSNKILYYRDTVTEAQVILIAAD